MSPEKHVHNRENLDGQEQSEIQARLGEILLRIELACARASRDPEEVTLIGASKTVPSARIESYINSGLQHVGENYVQEGVGKIEEIRRVGEIPTEDTCWHLIGSLQSNKAREAVENFDYIHSLDRPSLIEALAKAAREQNKVQKILIQVNVGREASKAGCTADDLSTLAALCREKTSLQMCGLMCLPPFEEDPQKMRPYFRELRRLRDEVLGNRSLHLSMGMSNDFEVAVEEGATMVRVGTALFGFRS